MNRQILYKKWVHSYEEDSENEKVFRPSDYSFPPSRGRKSFELKPGGVLIYTGLSPSDKHEPVNFKWDIKNNDLIFFKISVSDPFETLHLITADSERLVFKK